MKEEKVTIKSVHKVSHLCNLFLTMINKKGLQEKKEQPKKCNFDVTFVTFLKLITDNCLLITIH